MVLKLRPVSSAPFVYVYEFSTLYKCVNVRINIVTRYYDVLINRNGGPNSMLNVPNNGRPQLLFGITIITYDQNGLIKYNIYIIIITGLASRVTAVVV